MLIEFLNHIVNGVIIGANYALIAVGLSMIFGIMGVVNFAHGEFYMLGAYVLFMLTFSIGLNYYLSMILATLMVMLLAYLCEKVILVPLRGKGILSSMLAMVGVSIFLQNAALVKWGGLPIRIPHPFPETPIQIGPIPVAPVRLVAVLVACLLILGCHLLISRTKLGLAMRATFQDRQTAQLMGVNTSRIDSITFFMGGGLAAIAGVLLGPIFMLYPTMGELAVDKAFAVVILGGLGSFVGAIIGALIIGVTEVLGSAYLLSGYKDAIAFLVIILVLLFRPQGLMGRKEAIE